MSNSVVFKILAIDAFTTVGKKLINTGKKVTKVFRKLNKTQDEAAKKTKKFGNATRGMLANLAGGFTAFAAAQKFLTTGANFQDVMADVRAITGSTAEEMGFLTDETLRLAKASAISQDEVGTAFKVIASAKSELLKDPKALSQVASDVLVLANNGIELETAAKVTTQALNQFGVGADQANRFVNVLAAGARIGASEVAETGVAIVKSGAVAKSMGVGFEELNAAIQVLAKGGVVAEVAGTGLKTALIQLEKSGIKAIMPSVVGMTAAFETLQKANLNTTQQVKLFGSEALTIGQILTENVGTVRNWTGAVTGTNSAQEQADIRLKTFNANMRRIGITINAKIIKAFQRVEPVLTKNAALFGKWIDSLDEEKVASFADTLKLVINAGTKLVKIFGKVLTILEGVGNAIGQTVAAFATLDFDQFNLSPSAFFSDLFGGSKPSELKSPDVNNRSKTDVNIGIKAPEGVVESINKMTTGQTSGLDVGINMVTP